MLPADFTTIRLTPVPVASLSDMTALSPLDVVTKLKLLLIVIATLFGGMLMGAVVAWAGDRTDRAAMLRRIMCAPAVFCAAYVPRAAPPFQAALRDAARALPDSGRGVSH